jgi:hypothetical protein
MSGARRTALILGASLLLGLSSYHFAFSSWNSVSRGIVDFPIFTRHAEHFLETGELYVHADNLAAYAPGTAVYKFPPTYVMFLLPLVHDGIPEMLYYYHWAFLLAVYLGAVALALRVLRPSRSGLFLLWGALMALNLEPFFETLWRQQLEIPLLLLFVVCLWALLTKRDLPGGVAVGLGAMLKVYPAFVLLYLAARRRWKLIAVCLGAALLLQGASLVVIGLPPNQVYFSRILPEMLSETSKVIGHNLAAGRYLQEWFGFEPMAAKRIGQGLALGLLALFFWAAHHRRGDGRRERQLALEYSLFLALMLVWMPNSWFNYQLLLLPLYLVLLREALEPRRGRAWLLAALAAGYGSLLFYAPCAGPEMPWPCAETPRFLGLFRFPRALQDFMVQLRLLGTLLPLGAGFALLLAGRGTASSPAPDEA